MALSDGGGDVVFEASSSLRKKGTQEVQNEAWVVDQKHDGRAFDVLNRLQKTKRMFPRSPIRRYRQSPSRIQPENVENSFDVQA
jgi:hypothetical protein